LPEIRRPTLFCFGLGYCATRLARALRDEGWRIIGTSRDAAALRRLAAEGFEVLPFSREAPLGDGSALLGQASHVLSSVPPDELGDPVLDLCGNALRARAGLAGGGPIAKTKRTIQWIGYLSTTGVYGDRGGAEVDEMSALMPTSERGRRRVAAEGGWRALFADGLPVHIFRLAGIYGPGRSALDALRTGTARRVHKAGHVFSRIHVDDVVQVLRASIARPEPGATYNVCDDDPATSEEVVAFAAKLLGLAPPPLIDFEAADLSAMARSFYADNKRVSNRRIKALGVRLNYPSYRDGLAAIAAAASATPPADAR
jgi:nucleoside-diphosphate-sugar epimerase